MQTFFELSDFLQLLSLETLKACWKDIAESDDPELMSGLRDLSSHASLNLDDAEFREFTDYASTHKPKGH